MVVACAEEAAASLPPVSSPLGSNLGAAAVGGQRAAAAEVRRPGPVAKGEAGGREGGGWGKSDEERRENLSPRGMGGQQPQNEDAIAVAAGGRNSSSRAHILRLQHGLRLLLEIVLGSQVGPHNYSVTSCSNFLLLRVQALALL